MSLTEFSVPLLPKPQYLDQKGYNAHQIKKDIIGQKAPIKHYDLYQDTNSGYIYILRKGEKAINAINTYLKL